MVNIRMDSVHAFLAGYKPAILFNEDSYFPSLLDVLRAKGYPEYSWINSSGARMLMFFQTAEQRDKVAFIGAPNETVIGLMLGFPPQAVQFYAEGQKGPRLRIDYYGIKFVCSEDDYDDVVTWLDEKYKFGTRNVIVQSLGDYTSKIPI